MEANWGSLCLTIGGLFSICTQSPTTVSTADLDKGRFQKKTLDYMGEIAVFVRPLLLHVALRLRATYKLHRIHQIILDGGSAVEINLILIFIIADFLIEMWGYCYPLR